MRQPGAREMQVRAVGMIDRREDPLLVERPFEVDALPRRALTCFRFQRRIALDCDLCELERTGDSIDAPRIAAVVCGCDYSRSVDIAQLYEAHAHRSLPARPSR